MYTKFGFANLLALLFETNTHSWQHYIFFFTTKDKFSPNLIENFWQKVTTDEAY